MSHLEGHGNDLPFIIEVWLFISIISEIDSERCLGSEFFKIASATSNTMLIICSGWNTRNNKISKGFILTYGFPASSREAIDIQSSGSRESKDEVKKR